MAVSAVSSGMVLEVLLPTQTPGQKVQQDQFEDELLGEDGVERWAFRSEMTVVETLIKLPRLHISAARSCKRNTVFFFSQPPLG